MDSFSLAHSRRRFGAHLHLKLLFLEPSQWFHASGMMCNIFVDTCIRHSGVSADFLHLPLPQASLPRGCTALPESFPLSGLSLCCAGITLPPAQLLAAAQSTSHCGRSRCPSGAVLLAVWITNSRGCQCHLLSETECLVSLRP